MSTKGATLLCAYAVNENARVYVYDKKQKYDAEA